jgi:hypothetical protein
MGLFKPKKLMVASINLGIDCSVEQCINDLASYQARDKRIRKLIQRVQQEHHDARRRFIFKDRQKCPYWIPLLPTEIKNSVFHYVHTSLGHLVAEKSTAQIAKSFHVKSLGRKLKFISRCDICQRVNFRNRSCTVQNLSHLPTKRCEHCSVDLYGPLPLGRNGFR